jgi:hypothetical protein
MTILVLRCTSLAYCVKYRLPLGNRWENPLMRASSLKWLQAKLQRFSLAVRRPTRFFLRVASAKHFPMCIAHATHFNSYGVRRCQLLRERSRFGIRRCQLVREGAALFPASGIFPSNTSLSSCHASNKLCLLLFASLSPCISPSQSSLST